VERIELKKIASVAAIILTAAVGLHAQTFRSLVEFNGSNGAYPYLGSFVQGTDGNLYGMTETGGVGVASCPLFGCGTIFRMTPSGKLTTIYKFCSQANCTDGDGPQASLMLASNGTLYGTTPAGGAYGEGTVFSATMSGSLKTLYNFCPSIGTGICPDGLFPTSTLIQATNGNLYGTTVGGGAYGYGSVFEITLDGKLTTLYSFCSGGRPCSDGEAPWAGLAQGTDGNFYGTTAFGGLPEGSGTVFKITPTGKFKTLHSFCSLANCADGSYPYGGLTLSTDGNLYGTTNQGAASWGTAFKITPAGTLTTIYTFGSCSNYGCPDGALPFSSLTQGSDGNFYGATESGGLGQDVCGVQLSVGCGQLFQMTYAGEFTLLYNFCPQSNCSDGFSPMGAPFQATNGIFYGLTNSGGDLSDPCASTGCGTVYALSTNLPPFIEANPAFGKSGRVINILGNNLASTTSVTFNGVSANFKVISNTYVKAEVPSGATTGPIQLTTQSADLTSNVSFQVIP
jgi:uncharacterized repeat protein (TIGR03803 family)